MKSIDQGSTMHLLIFQRENFVFNAIYDSWLEKSQQHLLLELLRINLWISEHF